MPVTALKQLDRANKEIAGVVERYIYLKFQERQNTVAEIIFFLEAATPQTFQLGDLFAKFRTVPGIKRSIDKAYEIVVFSLAET